MLPQKCGGGAESADWCLVLTQTQFGMSTTKMSVHAWFFEDQAMKRVDVFFVKYEELPFLNGKLCMLIVTEHYMSAWTADHDALKITCCIQLHTGVSDFLT